MPRARVLSVAIAAFAIPVVLSACGSDGSGTSSAANTREEASGAEVQLKLIAFKPSALEVATGTRVTWLQGDPGSHTVTSGTVEEGPSSVKVRPDGTFASGDLATDDTFEFTFDEPGTFSYFCEIHPATMRGEITVR